MFVRGNGRAYARLKLRRAWRHVRIRFWPRLHEPLTNVTVDSMSMAKEGTAAATGD